MSAPDKIRMKTLDYSCPQTRKLQAFKSSASTLVGFELAAAGEIFGLSDQTPALTSEPIFSPVTTFRIFPRWFKLKTMMGRLLSLQREIAVESITLRPFFRTSM